MNSTGKTFLALLGGMAVGVATGVLIAPDKGKKTRKKLKNKAEKLSRDVENMAENAVNSIKQSAQEAEAKLKQQ